MQQYQHNNPARRQTYHKSIVFKMWLSALVVLGLLAFTQAVFAQTYTIVASAAPPGAGTISPSGNVPVAAGGSQTFTGTPTQAGYYLAGFQVDGGPYTANPPPSYTFTNVQANHNIVAFFSNTYYINASVSGGHGTISPAGSSPVNYGGTLQVTITPDSGYQVSDVLVDGVSVGAVTLYTFNNVSTNHTIVAQFASGSRTLTLLFDQSAYQGNVWLQVQDATQTFAATYAGGTAITFNSGDMMSAPVPLSSIGADGLTVSYANGAVLFVFYDDPTMNDRTQAPAQMTLKQRFMPVELTMTGAAGDGGDLTAINYFTSPLSIRSYANNPIQNPGAPVLQQTGWGSATAKKIGRLMATASGGNPDAVVKEANGRIIRYLGPSNSFTGTNPWPSLLPYTLSIYTANQPTTIENSNGFTFYKADGTTPDGPEYIFGANMTATANMDGSLAITGSITASTQNGQVKSGNPALPAGGAWSNAEFDFSASDPNAFNNAIYGQVQTSAVTFKNETDPTSAWYQFKQFTQKTLKDPSLRHDPVTNPSLYDNVIQSNGKAGLNAYNTTLNMFIGEVTTGLLGGFFNSDYQPGGVPPAIKNMPSYQWWALNPLVAFSTIQPLHPYYNLYAQVIFDESHNTVYGLPYSDRFGKGPEVNSVSYTTGGVSYSVNYWMIGIGAPLGTTQTALPGVMLLLE